MRPRVESQAEQAGPRATIRVVDPLALLASRLPPDAFTIESVDLAEGSRDWWTLAMLRETRGDGASLPAAVVRPATTEDVATVLAWASETRTPVVARGGGSGVCGGVRPSAGWIVLDLSRMDRILDLDVESQVVHVEAGMNGERLEAELQANGLTLGHYPQSIAISTVGGWIAASSAGQASAGHGAIEDHLLGLTAVLAGGRIVRLRPVPRSASGPDLRRLLVGSEGTLAVVTDAWLGCSAPPPGYAWDAFGFPSFHAVMDGLRDVVRAHTGATFIRGYDQTDSALNFGSMGHAGGCAAIVGFASDLPGLEARRTAAAEAARSSGGTPLGEGYGHHWEQHRNDAVELYRRVMGPERLFGPGVAVDTMEVAGLWSGLRELEEGVRSALAAHTEAVGCHLSHVYPAGSSLYFTFLLRGTDDRTVEATYLAAWEDAVRACLEAGGTMTHHHGVGRLKAPFLEEELGREGFGMLRAIKDALDPAGVLNPGALLP